MKCVLYIMINMKPLGQTSCLKSTKLILQNFEKICIYSFHPISISVLYSSII